MFASFRRMNNVNMIRKVLWKHTSTATWFLNINIIINHNAITLTTFILLQYYYDKENIVVVDDDDHHVGM